MRYSRITPFLFIAPMLIGLLIFRLLPIGVSFGVSFADWNVFSPPRWAGLANYRQMLESPAFWEVARNTVVFALVFVPLVMAMGLSLALLVNQKLRFSTFFRGVFFMPYITSIVAVAIAWRWILATRFGLLNNALTELFGIVNPPSWLGDPRFALLAVAFVLAWQSAGFQMLLFLAGLQNIDESIKEAAEIDGASRWQVFLHITLPLLSPITFFVLIISLIASSQTFEVTYALTGGGPQRASTTLAFYIYQNAFVHFQMGFASALAYALLLFVGGLTLINFWFRRRWVHYG